MSLRFSVSSQKCSHGVNITPKKYTDDFTNVKDRNIENHGDRLRLVWRDPKQVTLTDLSGADLSGADLSETDLSGTNLRFADLSGASLSSAKVMRAKFGSGSGIPEAVKQDLIARGAIFDEANSDRSSFRIPVPH